MAKQLESHIHAPRPATPRPNIAARTNSLKLYTRIGVLSCGRLISSHAASLAPTSRYHISYHTTIRPHPPDDISISPPTIVSHKNCHFRFCPRTICAARDHYPECTDNRACWFRHCCASVAKSLSPVDRGIKSAPPSPRHRTKNP